MRALLAISIVTLGCASGGNGRGATGYPGAAANVGAAALLYGVWGGCKNAGCPTGNTCNQKTERCDPLPCGAQGCSVSETCNERMRRCEPKP